MCIQSIYKCISGDTPLQEVYARATNQITKAYAQGLQQSYYNKFVLFLGFCQKCKLYVHNITIDNAILFIEVLAASNQNRP